MNGLVHVIPTSVVVSGTSATINPRGGVDVLAATSVSLNDVFTSTYSNYIIMTQLDWSSSGGTGIDIRLRAAGTDSATSIYDFQILRGSGSTASGSGSDGANLGRLGVTDGVPGGQLTTIYGPALANETVMRSMDISGVSDARIDDIVTQHQSASAYDGFTLSVGSGTITGKIHVYGLVE